MDSAPGQFSCRFCGRVHRRVELRRGERAVCVECGATLLRRAGGADATMAFTLAALILAVPAFELPLVTVRKFGVEHASYLWTGIHALWQNGMPLLSIWVAFCGAVVPAALLTTLVFAIAVKRLEPGFHPRRIWIRTAQAFQHWSMPEVQVLAILVAFVKIGALVQVTPDAGLWFYGAMAVAMLAAWRSAELPGISP